MKKIFFTIVIILKLTLVSCTSLDEMDSINTINEDFIKNNIDYKTILDVTDTLKIDSDYYLISYYLKSADVYIQDLRTGNIQIQISNSARDLLNRSMADGQFETVIVSKKRYVLYSYRTSSKPMDWPNVKFAYYYNPKDYLEKFKELEIIEKNQKPTQKKWLYRISDNYIFFKK